jgi:TATA-binding protein-associated factor Taf7
MNAVKNNAYATTLHRSINNKGLTFCENNLNLENVTNIEIGEMKMSNDCDVGEFQDETEGVSQQVKEDLENEAKAAANRAAQSNEEDDEDADGENDEDEEEDPSGMDEYLTTENLSIGGGLLLFICMCCCLLLIMMMMMK